MSGSARPTWHSRQGCPLRLPPILYLLVRGTPLARRLDSSPLPLARGAARAPVAGLWAASAVETRRKKSRGWDLGPSLIIRKE